MPTDPLTGSRYPVSGDAPTIWTYIENAVKDLSDNTFPRFASTTARDTAFASWVGAGNAMTSGLHCHVTGIGDQVYSTSAGAWLLLSGQRMHGLQTTSFVANSTEARVTGGTNVTDTLVTGRKYEIKAQGAFDTDVDGNTAELRLRGARSGTPTTTSTVLAISQTTITSTARPNTWNLYGTFGVTVTASHTLSLFLRRFGGSGTVTVGVSGSGVFEYTITDIGPYTSGVPLIP